jgi:glycosyltransferase involved in cell wall biosynthesis
MKLLVFCDEDLGSPGGGSRQVLELSKALIARGHELRIIAPRISSLPPPPSLPVLAVPGFPLPGLRPFSYLILSTLVMLTVLYRWRPDALWWFDSPGQVGPLLGTRLASCPYLLFVNGLPQEELRGVWRWPPIMRFLAWGLRRAVARAAAVVSVCDGILAWMQREWRIEASRCHVVKNGVDPEGFRPIQTGEARRALGLDQERPCVGFVGGFFPWHGLDKLIQAVPAVRQAVPNVCFLLVGDGSERHAVGELADRLGIRDACLFPGPVPFDEVPRWIAAADVCVALNNQTRLYAGDSMKLWEYLACARPVVATAGPGFGDAVEAMGSGLAVKVNDAQGLAEALVRLLQDTEERARMGERGRAAVEQAHTWDARAAVIESLFQRIIRDEARG